MRFVTVDEWRTNQSDPTNPQPSNDTASPSRGFVSVSEWRAKRRMPTRDAYTSAQNWQTGANDLLREYSEFASNYSSDPQTYDDYRRRMEAYSNQYDTLIGGLQQDTEAADSVSRTQLALRRAMEGVGGLRDFYAQFGSQEEYDQYARTLDYANKYTGKSYSELVAEMDRLDPNSEEYGWVSAYAPTTMTTADYDAEIADANKRLEILNSITSPDQWREDLFGEFYAGADAVVRRELEDEIVELQRNSWLSRRSDEYGAVSENADFDSRSSAERGFTQDGAYNYINNINDVRSNRQHTKEYQKYDYMTDEQVATYNYLYNTEGKRAAREYLDYLDYELDAQASEAARQNWRDLVNQNAASAIGANVVSVGSSVLSGLSAAAIIAQRAANTIRGKITGEYRPVNYNTGLSNIAGMTTAIRDETAQNIIENTGVINLDPDKYKLLSRVLNGKGLADVYQLGMSIADSAVSYAFAPILGKASTIILGGAAAAQTMADYAVNGATEEQAITMGIITGAIEMITEELPLDSLMKFDSNTIAKSILKQIGTEGLEESAATFFGNIADILVMADESMQEEAVAEYMRHGLSRTDAELQVLLDNAIQIGWDFVGGALSGGVMGGTHGAIGTVQRNSSYRSLYGSDISALVDEALDIDPNNTLAQRMRKTLDNSGRITGGQIYNLVQQNEAGMSAQDVANIQGRAMERLNQLGEIEDVHAISAALAKQAAGQKLTRQEQTVISASKYGRRVANELQPDSIRSGDYTSRWTRDIGTERINVSEYNRIVSDAQAAQETAQTVAMGTSVPVAKAAPSAPVQPVTDANVGHTTGSDTNVPITSEPVQEEKPVTLEEASKKYGVQAKAMVATYNIGGGNQDVAKFDAAYQIAYDMGYSGVPLSYAMKSDAAGYLSENQRELAYEAGTAASTTAAAEQEAKNKAAVNGNTGRKKGVVKGEGVTISDLEQTFNDTQGRAYKYLSNVAEITGVDIILYKSEANAEGKFEGAQGKFKWSDNTVYIDVNAGLYGVDDVNKLHKYAMLRTFAHEFTHFIEKWNPVQYNEFRKVVFDTLTERGENVNDLIEQKLAQDSTGKMTYDKASREVVAEAMTDILPDANFVQELAENHKTIFQKLLEKLKEFVDNLKAYFKTIGGSYDRGAISLKEQVGDTVKYLDSIVQLFDKVAVQAVENYQKTIAVAEETTVTEEVSESEEVTEETSEVATKEPVAEVDGDNFTITENAEHGSLEISFDGKPPAAVIAALKEKKFRWHGKKKIWYGYSDRAEIVFALRAAYEAQPETAAEAPVQEVTQEPAAGDTVAEETEEVTANGKNADNQGAAQQSEPDGSGAAQVLDELQTEDVQGDGRSRDTVGSPAERGQETVRDGGGSDYSERTGGGPGEGDRQSGDLRRDDGLTSKAAEQLHEEVAEQIAQQSTEQPKGRNFVIGDSLDLPIGEKARYKANVEAIRLVKKLEAEGRYATEAEQAILSKYVGWGGLANAFDGRKADWSKEFKELKELLTDEEYSLARGSTLNAHYTDISVIKAMYVGLQQLGFTGGRMLEPSSGVGNFVGAMPADMSAKVRSWTMVELDGITGLIAKYLYPNADVRIQGFEKSNIPNNFMDVAISNVPFGNYSIADKAYPKKVTSAIHNYFFAKSLDKVRPGGIVMFITSSYTMNSKDSTVRRYIMQRADLLGAIRLPDSAFKGNAGTEVVTDILILKKRAANTDYAGENFLEAPYEYISGYHGANINTYFKSHPEMVLGTPTMTGGMYRGDSLTYKALEGKGSLADQIREAFTHITGKMEYPAQTGPEKTNFAVERASKKTKNNGLVVKDGKVYRNENGELVEQKVAKGAAERISGMLEIRDAARDLMNHLQQGLIDSEVRKARQKLNKAYDAFVKKYGFINSQVNRNAIKDDPDSFSILALENWNPDTKTATKADIFAKNTIAPNRTVTSAKDVAEGLIVSVNQTGGVDAALIARLTGKTKADVTRELLDSRQVFKNRDGDLESAEVYLSGNVRAKLREAEALVPMDADYQKNVEALKAVMPEDVGYQDIFVNPGTPWIPDSVYSDFAAYMLGSANSEWRQAVEVTHNKDTGNFTVELKNHYLKSNSYNTQKWGTNRRSFLDLFDAMLNSRSVVVKNKTDDGKSVIDRDATAAANEKIENIQKEFQEWLWKDETRRTELATLYNETFNSIVTPTYNGDNLTVNGANAMKPLRPHQRNAVQRVISSGGNTLLAHKVGAGKTYEMAAAAMKLKQLGLVKKPMFVVPKSLVAQWGNEFVDFFPTAKMLVAEASDFTAGNRKVFMNRIANGDYDAVIVSYEQFERLPVSNDFARELYQEQIDSIIRAIEDAKAEKGGKSLSVKDLEKKRKQLQTKIDKLTDSAKDADNIDFEQLGVDSLFVDEAHNFKNLFYTTSMTNVSGLGNKDGSKRAFDLYTKVRFLQKLNGGRGIVFATATPVMNSMSEMYIMQRYLQPDLLDQLGLSTFDAWAKQFGEVVNGVEIKPSGQGYRVKQSFSRFKNMSELQLLFRNFADVLTDIPGLKIPKMKGGKVNVVVCEPGQFQQDYMKELEQRADNVKNVDPSVDNMLKITSDGRKISYTQRMIDPSLPYEEGCKIFRCADNVARVYKDSKTVKGTQLIFCDMATPKGKSNTAATETEETETDMESARLYDDIKARLIQNGIPAREIAFIHEADTDAKKKKLFADVNEGKVRVLIGSTGKMGVGMNAQKRVVAIHHLDAPWRPGDVEQRNGRAYRQGNINDEVECFTYVTEGSFDARLWDILERKQNFINQVMNGENVGRETEDTGEVTLSAAEVKALASGSPLIMEQVQLDTDIKKLESLYRAHRSAVTNAVSRLAADKGRIAVLEKMIANGKVDVAARVDTYSEGNFSITIGKKKYTDKKDAGAKLMVEATAKANEDGYTTIAKFAGFDLRVIKTHEGIKGLISGAQGYSFNTYPGNTTYMINHLIAKVEEISEAVSQWEQEITQTRSDMAEQEKLIAQPFARQAELDQKRSRYKEVMEILNPKEEQALDSMDDDTVQEQSREYLSADRYITRDMTSTERYDLLKHRGIVLKAKAETDELRRIEQELGQSTARVNLLTKTERKKLFVKIGEEFGVFKRFENLDVELSFEFSKNNMRESISKQKKNYEDFAKMFTCFDDVIDAAVGIEVHNRNADVYKYDPTLKDTYVLVSAFEDGDYVIPVKLEIKEFTDKENSLYVAIALERIKKDEVVKQGNTDTGVTQGSRSSVIRLADLFSKVNPADESFLKYVPEQFLTVEDTEQNQQRVKSLSDREVLEMAAGNVNIADLTDGERDALNIFQKRLSRLQELEEQRAEQGRIYKEQQFGAKVNREEAAKTLNRMRLLDDQIKAANDDIFTIEEKAVLRTVLKKARAVVELEERQHGQELLKRWRDRRNNAAAIKKYRERLRGDVEDLTNWVLHPNNKDVVKHIPDALKESVIPFLASINFMSKQSLKGGNPTVADKEFMKRLNVLKSVLNPDRNIDGMYADYTDLPPNFMDRLQTFIDSAQALVENNNGDFIINQMTSEELKELSQVVRTLKKYIQQFNRFHVNAMFQHVYEAGDNSIGAMVRMESAGPHTGAISNFVLWQQMRPPFAFERFGDGGKAIYDGLRRGQATLAFNTKKIQAFAEKAYTAAEVKAWENEIKEIRLGSETIRIPVSTIMSLYELSKREQALGHILGGGIRVATYTRRGKKISDTGHTITQDDLSTIISRLTPRQKEVADNLQKFMQEQGGKWGNYVSLKRFGEELFGEDHYFPINSDGRHLSANAEEHPSAASLYALLNMGFTKALQEGANNRIVLYSIFDVFANHMASMAQYNAFALPVVDAIKWFNYQQRDFESKELITSVRDQMDRVYGVPEETKPGSGRQGYAQSFVINIIKAFNGTEAQGTPTDATGLTSLRRYNMAQVAYNFRVVVQQPLAITRAALLVDYGSILKGMKLSPAAIRNNIEEMQKYSGIAAWKSLGFYDVNISRGLTALIKHDETVMDKISDVGMWGAEKADLMTWAWIWSAAKEEVIRKQHLKPKDEGFYEAVTTLFEDIIYKTQVVDSVLTKNEFMRDKGFFARAVGSFMSEPTTTASMLVDAYDKYHADIQRGWTRQEAWKRNSKYIVRVTYVYALGALLLAAVQAVADAFRDDDDYQTFLEKWLEAFGGNLVDELMPLNKLPIVSDFYEVAKEIIATWTGLDIYGNAPQSVFMQWYDSLIKGMEILHDRISGADTNYTWYGGAYKLLQAISGMVGLPLAAATREAVTAWNNIVGGMAPSLKVKTYEPSEQAQIKYAYQDGYLTMEEAMDQLIQQGLVDTEDEAYWMVQGLEAGDGYSKYDAIFDAVRNGADINAAMAELTAHGYTEKDVLSEVKSQIGEWYKGGEISKQQAVNMLTRYFDMDSDEITGIVNRWSSVVVTGIAFEDIKDEYLMGNITAQRAIEMYVLYGGYSQEKATETVTKWRAERETGIAYYDIEDAFMDGEISEADARNMYITYGGYTEEEASEKATVLAFVKKHPDCDGISYAAVENYTTYCEPSGVPAGTFYDAWQYNSSTHADVDENGESISGSKKVKVLDYINGLDLTSAQKDSLYFAFGWAESRIYEAPWH